MEKQSIPWKTIKGTCNSSLLKNKKALGRWNYEIAWKMAEDSGTKWWICCSIKYSMKIKNVSFVFSSKPKELFCQPNTLLLLKLPALHRGDNLYGYILRGSQRYSIPISVLSQKPTCHAENIWPLASSQQRQGILLNSTQCTGQLPTTKNHLVQNVTSAEAEKSHPMCQLLIRLIKLKQYWRSYL